MGCSAFYQNDFIKDVKLEGEISNNVSIGYRLYQTGFDNFRYEFYSIQKSDTLELFKTYLNDATYKNVRFEMLEQRDTICIYSNFNLGEAEKIIREIHYKLNKMKVER